MKVSVIITAYNHEKYIKQCIESILNQTGDFELEIILGDDCSTDGTGAILEEYQQKSPALFHLLPRERNLGVTKNLKRCLDACTGDYIAICEGDDYWTSPHKLQKQAQHLESHPHQSMCFSLLTLYYQQEDRSIPHPDQVNFPGDELTIYDLIGKNVIGNFSCCMYRASVVRSFSPKMFDFYTVDWMFNIACADRGNIGFLRESMSVYRLHASGSWTGKREFDQIADMLRLIGTYNQFLEFRYHEQFSAYRKSIEDWMGFKYGPEYLADLLAAAGPQPLPEPVVAAQIPAEGGRMQAAGLAGRVGFLIKRMVKSAKDILRPYWWKVIRFRNKAWEYLRSTQFFEKLVAFKNSLAERILGKNG